MAPAPVGKILTSLSRAATTPPLGIAAFEELSVIDLPIVYSMKNGEETIREDRLPLFLLLSHY